MRKFLKKYAMAPDHQVTGDLRLDAVVARDLVFETRYERSKMYPQQHGPLSSPARKWDVKMLRFQSVGSAQHFLSSHAADNNNTSNVQRHFDSAWKHDALRTEALAT